MLKTVGESIITMKLVDKKGSLNSYSVLIKSDYGSYNLPSIDSAEFPIIEHGKDRKELLLPSTIVDSISEALPFMAKDELRPAITQLLLHKVKDEVKVVATDAHSLYLDTFPILSEGYGDDSYQINIPPRAASTIVSINLNAPIPVIHSNKNTLFILGDYDLTVINIQDKFPHYEAIIPEKHNFKYTFTKAQFEGAVKRAAIFNESFKLSLNEGNKNQIVAYNVETQKEMKEDLPGVSYGVLDIGMGTEYTLRALSALKEKEVEMELISNNKAIVFNEGQKKVLVMPIMVP
jgi:DNA polymerase III sliding clamp (beta) subunit (PCNA family)